MVNVLTEIIISLPVDKVSAYVSNPDNASEWYKNIISAEWKTPKPMAVGTQVAFNAKFLGRKLSYTYEFVEFIPGEKLVMKTAEGPFPMETTYTWETTDDGKTKMTLRNRGIPSGFSKLMAPMMATAMKKANIKDLKNLKRILENRSAF